MSSDAAFRRTAIHPIDVQAAGLVGRCSRRAGTTASHTRSAASTDGTCSQMRITRQPAASKLSSLRLSRATLRSSFARHQSPFARGSVPWSGQRCQKQPSTNTTTLAFVNTMSARHRSPTTGEWSTRNRSPRRCNSRRTAISGPVSRRRLASPIARAAGDEGGGDRSLLGIPRRMPAWAGQRPRLLIR